MADVTTIAKITAVSDMQQTRRRRANRAGHWAETAAIMLLRVKGYRIAARRYKAAGGELDIVAVRGGVIAFVEVKYRVTIDQARTAIPAQKRQRIASAARHWLAHRNGHDTKIMQNILRGDAVFVAPWRIPRHEENLFELEL